MEDLQAFNVRIETMFSQLTKQRKDEDEGRTLMEIQHKMKAIDLLEVYFKAQQTSEINLTFIKPLINAMISVDMKKNQKNEFLQKTQSLLNKISKMKLNKSGNELGPLEKDLVGIYQFAQEKLIKKLSVPAHNTIHQIICFILKTISPPIPAC